MPSSCAALPVALPLSGRLASRPARGLTLIEWLISLALLAVLATVAAPGMSGFLQRGGTDAAARSLVRSIAQARNVALQQGRGVTLRLAQSLAQGCGSGAVTVAWALQAQDAAGSTQTLECLSAADMASRWGVSLSVGSASALRFNATGLADNAATVDVTFTRGSRSVVVRIYPGGTARVL